MCYECIAYSIDLCNDTCVFSIYRINAMLKCRRLSGVKNSTCHKLKGEKKVQTERGSILSCLPLRLD